jgi:predicted amidophosphoribosyltransferase
MTRDEYGAVVQFLDRPYLGPSLREKLVQSQRPGMKRRYRCACCQGWRETKDPLRNMCEDCARHGQPVLERGKLLDPKAKQHRTMLVSDAWAD